MTGSNSASDFLRRRQEAVRHHHYRNGVIWCAAGTDAATGTSFVVGRCVMPGSDGVRGRPARERGLPTPAKVTMFTPPLASLPPARSS